MVTITMSERQYDKIMEGMEFYNRFLCAQPDNNRVLFNELYSKTI